jgi:hypothetical protein
MHQNAQSLLHAIAQLPTISELKKIRRRNLSVVLQQEALGFDRLSLAHRAVDTSVGEGKRPRSPEQTQDADDRADLDAPHDSVRGLEQSDEGVGSSPGEAAPPGFASQLADDLEEFSEDELADDLEEFSEDELADDLGEFSEDELVKDGSSPLQKPSQSTQLEEMELDADGRRGRVLVDLRDAVVALLRSLSLSGSVTSEQQKEASALRRRVGAFAGSNEHARSILTALAEVLLRPVDAASAAGGDPEEENDENTARIMGRAEWRGQQGGAVEQLYLLRQDGPRRHEWLTEAGMRADAALGTILDAYEGQKGSDPSGNGFVTAVLGARGPGTARQIKVQWTVQPDVPVRYAQEWIPRFSLISTALADAFERGDDEGSDPSDGEGDGMDAGPQAAPSALKWDPGAGRPKLSWRQAIRLHAIGNEWTVKALIEWTLNRRWALLCQAPPAAGQPGAPTEAELEQVGKDLFTIDSKALEASYRRQRELERRGAAQARQDDGGDEEEGDGEDEDEDAALAAWRQTTEQELRRDAEARWVEVRRVNAPRLDRLRAQLVALKAIEATGGNDPSAVDAAALGATDPDAAALIAAWSGDANWPKGLRTPLLRLPKIRDFLSTPYRSPVAKGFLQLQRDEIASTTPDQRRTTTKGSAYGPSWSARPTPTSTPADHVTAVRWFSAGTELLSEAGSPAQLPAVVLCTLAENSAKGDDALGVWLDDSASAGQDVYNPRVPDVKKAMLAKHVAWVFGLYALISNKKRTAGVTAYADGATGVAWWARSWQRGSLRDAMLLPASGFERQVHLLSAAMPRWGICNPVVFDTSHLDSDMQSLLLDRLRGKCATAMLVDAALQAAVTEAPR